MNRLQRYFLLAVALSLIGCATGSEKPMGSQSSYFSLNQHPVTVSDRMGGRSDTTFGAPGATSTLE
jgi:hypothetical protein